MSSKPELDKFVSNFLESNDPSNRFDEDGRIKRSVPRLSVYRKFESPDFSKLQKHKQEIIELVSNNFKTEEEGLNQLKKNGELRLQESLFRYLAVQEIRPCCSKYPGIWPFCKSNC